MRHFTEPMNPSDHKPMLYRSGGHTRLVCTCGDPLGDIPSGVGMTSVVDRMYRHREKLRAQERLTR